MTEQQIFTATHQAMALVDHGAALTLLAKVARSIEEVYYERTNERLNKPGCKKTSGS